METLLLSPSKRPWLPEQGWSELPPLPFPLTQHASAISDGYLYVKGGSNSDGPQDIFIRAKIGEPGWESLDIEGTPQHTVRSTLSAYKGKLIHYGGWRDDGTSTGDLDVLDTRTMTWSHEEPSTDSYSHSAAISEGRLIFTGGFRRDGNYAVSLESERLLDLETLSWLPSRGLLQAVGDTGTACNGGPDVWYYGGSSKDSAETLLLRRDDAFTHKPDHLPGRRNHTMTFLTEQDIYAFGSYADIGENYFERFNTVSEQWETLTGVPPCRYNHTANKYKGCLVIVGGTITGGAATDKIIVYRP